MTSREILLADIEAKRREKAAQTPQVEFDDDLQISDDEDPSDGGGYNPYDHTAQPGSGTNRGPRLG